MVSVCLAALFAVSCRDGAGREESRLSEYDEAGSRYWTPGGPSDAGRKQYEWFKSKADSGDARAQAWMGETMENGYEAGGVYPSKHSALEWYRKAATNGNAQAQFSLGRMLDEGESTPQDFTESAAWLRKAAEQGHDDAMFMLGDIYSKGRGVPGLLKDPKEAAKWVLMAAECGNVEAQLRLALMSEMGFGIEPDLVGAYKWSSIAASRGKKGATLLRDSLAERLSPDQLADGQRRAQTFQVAKKGQNR